ncbi:MAG: NAD-binding protein, partial [Planctomycetota bacterium]
PDASLVVVAVSADEAARSIVQQTRRLHPQARILVRCRFQSSVRDLRRLGPEQVVSEEPQAYARLIAYLERDGDR